MLRTVRIERVLGLGLLVACGCSSGAQTVEPADAGSICFCGLNVNGEEANLDCGQSVCISGEGYFCGPGGVVVSMDPACGPPPVGNPGPDAGSVDGAVDSDVSDGGALEDDASQADSGGAACSAGEQRYLQLLGDHIDGPIGICLANGVDGATREIAEPQVEECLAERNPSLSAACLSCIDDLAQCAVDRCFDSCAADKYDYVTTDCRACRAAWCDDAYRRCTTGGPSL